MLRKFCMLAFLLTFGFSPAVSAQNDSTDAFWTAVRNGKIKQVKSHLDAGMDPNVRFMAGMTALNAACWRGHTEVVKLLLERGADPSLRDDYWKLSTVGFALMTGNTALLSDLMKKTSADSELVLRVGAARGSTELVQLALANHTLDPDDLAAAWYVASKNDKSEVLKALEAHGVTAPVPVQGSLLEKYTGRFVTEEGEEIILEASEGKLLLSSIDILRDQFQTEVALLSKDLLLNPARQSFRGKFLWQGDTITGLEIISRWGTTSLKKTGEDE